MWDGDYGKELVNAIRVKLIRVYFFSVIYIEFIAVRAIIISCGAVIVCKGHPHWKTQQLSHFHSWRKLFLFSICSQVSGLGASGSFQLAETFTPSPSLLQGKDVTDDDPGSEESDANEDAVDASLYHDAYVPRPTSRGRGRKLAAVVQRFDPSLPNPEAKHLVSRMRKKLSESVSARRASGVKDERHKAEAKKRGPSSLSNKRSPPKKKIKKLYTEDVSESDSEQSDDSNSEVYTPRKTKSRGGVVSLPPPKRQIDKQRKTVDRRNKVVVPAAKSTSTSKSSNQRVSLQLAKVAVDRRQKPSAKKPEKPIKSKLAVKRLSGGMKPRISSRIASVKKRRGWTWLFVVFWLHLKRSQRNDVSVL